MNTLKFELEAKELDVVMNGLMNMPWHISNPVIQKIIGQANAPQQTAPEAPAENLPAS